MFKSFFSKNHLTKIITHALYLSIALIMLLSITPKTQAAEGEACCDAASGSYQINYDPITDKCVVVGGHGATINTNCSSDESCVSEGGNYVCTSDENVDNTPPAGSTCGYLGQACCAPGNPSGITGCVSGLTTSKKINNISDYTGCTCIDENDAGGNPSVIDPTEGCGSTEINTAFGCLSTEPQEFTTQLFVFIVGIVGLISLIMMLVGVLIFMTGGSNPEQVKRGKEIFMGALIGLLFVIFSGVILQVIAGDIIQLPEFATSPSAPAAGGGSGPTPL